MKSSRKVPVRQEEEKVATTAVLTVVISDEPRKTRGREKLSGSGQSFSDAGVTLE
jgi:hypothetical protein